MLSTLTMIALSFAAPSLLPRVVEPSTGLEEILQLVAAENVTTPPVAVQPLPTLEEPKEQRLICKGSPRFLETSNKNLRLCQTSAKVVPVQVTTVVAQVAMV
jgi:hypothetical protein